ncbi:MAG: HEAT repeat domain-containing protein [Gemmataceae bacterium]|nr:HEAT repeat domain-containing protein [Gemmataceae bacterium]
MHHSLPRCTTFVLALAAGLLFAAPAAAQQAPAQFTFQKGDRVILLGNTFAERAREFGYIEALLQARYPDLGLTFRNLGYAADEVWLQPRPLNFADTHTLLSEQKADVILVCFGLNEAFRGAAALKDFAKALDDQLRSFASRKYNGKTPPRLILVSPIAHERLGGELPDSTPHNMNLRAYTKTMRKVAEANKIPFIDLYTPTLALMNGKHADRLTFNGIHLTGYGYWAVAHEIAAQLGATVPAWSLKGDAKGGKMVDFGAQAKELERYLLVPPPPASVHIGLDGHLPRAVLKDLAPGRYTLKINGVDCLTTTNREWAGGVILSASPLHDAAEKRRAAIVDRNREFFYQWRAVNGEYIYGRRARPFGVVNFPGEMQQLDKLVREGDARIRSLNKVPAVKSVELVEAAAEKQPPVQTARKPEPNTAMVKEMYRQTQGHINGKLFPTANDPEEARQHFKLAPGYEINLFASEKDFPLHNPLAMQFDSKGRLWVSTMPSYPHYLPGHPPNDQLLILEDTNGDGKADKHSVFADKLYLPTGFEFGDGGVYVGAQPHLLFLRDTDGDGFADERRTVLYGFGSGDSHHAIHTFVWAPDGGLHFHEGIFHRTGVETPHGPVRQAEAGIYRYLPRRQKLEVFVSYNFANPWGHVYDRWGQNLIADASGGANYFGLPLTGHVEYPRQHPGMKVFTSVVRPTCTAEIVSSRHFPPAAQGNFLVPNNIGFQGIKQHRVIEEGSGFTSKEVEPLLFSTDPNFRPVGIMFGPDGALYVVDWFNPLVGHMQHSIRDPGRDHYHGRIWRITAKGRPLVTPTPIAGAPLPKLLDALKSYEDRTRYRVRRELRDRNKDEVAQAVKGWIAKLDSGDKDYEHHLLEALWVYQTVNVIEPQPLRQLLRAKDYHARAAATRALRHWRESIPDALDLLQVQVNDEHPRVRLEAVVALSFFKDARAAEIALQALSHPRDYYLDYGLRETMTTLEPEWKAALTSGKPFAITTPAAATFVLGSVGTAELVKMTRTAPVYMALLSREGVLPKYRHEALEGLAKLNRTDVLTELFAAIERIDTSADTSPHVLHDLAHLLTERKADELKALRPRLEKLAAGGRLPLTRQVGYVALITADGSLDRTWAKAAQSLDALRDVVEAVPIIPDAKLRASAYAKVSPLLHGLPAPLAAQAKKTVAPRGRFVRIELPGKKRTLTLAEVQVFSDGVNVAPRGKARQHSLAHGGAPRRAIDGNTSGTYADGSQTHTTEAVTSPWWEVDLGGEVPVEAVVIWNRNESQLGLRLEGFKVVVLDAQRRPVWTRADNPAPKPSVRFDLGSDPAGTIRQAAMNAVTFIEGHEAETFRALAQFVREDDARAAAVKAIRRLPRTKWPADAIRPLLKTILGYVSKLPDRERTEPAVIDALQLGNDLTTLLPAKEAKAIRAKLGDLGVNVVLVRAVPHKMAYDRTRIYVEAGKPVVLVFDNTDIMPHNLLITVPGALAEVGMAADLMATNPKAFALHFIPKTDKVLHATRLLQPREVGRLQFTAPKTPGEYPYLCTFPGHWRVMFGTMHVVPKLADIPPSELDPVVAEFKSRPFVRNWTIAEVAPDLERMDRGRSFERGKALFAAASCVQCHKAGKDGGIIGPDLAEIVKKLADRKYTRADLLRDVIEPSKVIHEKFKTWVIETGKGELVTGVIVAQDGKSYKVVTNPNLPPRDIAVDDVIEKRESKLSLMPQGLLVTLDRDEILDLLAFVAAGGDPEHPAFVRREKHGGPRH